MDECACTRACSAPCWAGREGEGCTACRTYTLVYIHASIHLHVHVARGLDTLRSCTDALLASDPPVAGRLPRPLRALPLRPPRQCAHCNHRPRRQRGGGSRCHTQLVHSLHLPAAAVRRAPPRSSTARAVLQSPFSTRACTCSSCVHSTLALVVCVCAGAGHPAAVAASARRTCTWRRHGLTVTPRLPGLRMLSHGSHSAQMPTV